MSAPPAKKPRPSPETDEETLVLGERHLTQDSYPERTLTQDLEDLIQTEEENNNEKETTSPAGVAIHVASDSEQQCSQEEPADIALADSIIDVLENLLVVLHSSFLKVEDNLYAQDLNNDINELMFKCTMIVSYTL